MQKQEKEKNIFYITHSGELLFWLVVVLVLVFIHTSTSLFKEKHDENDYQIFLQDVDGLIVGSPVRMMGIEVGHVTKIKPTNKEVYVKFVLTNPDVYIPQGTEATVEFSGMAGSKSLELYLPNSNTYVDKSTPLLTVNPPKRLHDALTLLNDMFKKLGSIIYTTSDFGNKLNEKGLQTNGLTLPSKDAKDFLLYSDKFLDESTQKANKFQKKIKELN